MNELFIKLEVGELKSLLADIDEDPGLVNAVSGEGLSLFEALLKNGYTRASKHIIAIPEFDVNHQGHNPLRISVAMGCVEIAQSLIEKGASPNYRPEGITSALLLCLENEYFDLAELMVSHGAEVDIRNDQGWTPLIWASMKGRRRAVDFLISHGANIHACNNDGWNAVTGAYFKKRTDLVEFLLSKGAVFGAKYAEAALLSAYDNGYKDVVAHLIDDLGTNPNVADTANVSLLAKAVNKGDWGFVKILLEKDADVNVCDAGGVSVLALLAGNGNDDIMKLFLDKGADIHLASKTGMTAIYIAAKNNYVDSVRFLVEKGADVNVQTNKGWTPLIAASDNGNLAMVNLLLEQGANSALALESGHTAKQIAFKNAPRPKGYTHLADSAYKTITEKLTLPGHSIYG